MNNKLIIVLALILVFASFKLMQKLGLIETSEQRKISQIKSGKRDATGMETNPLNPLFVTHLIKYSPKGKRVKLLPQSAAAKIAGELYESKGLFKDDDSKAISLIKQLETQSQVSQVSQAFTKIYNKDLGTYLSFLDDNNYNSLIETVLSMPKGLY